jgi:soluble cytochrome b562
MATSLISTLKLVAATRENKTSPVLQRRQKLIKKIDEQMELAKAQVNGSIYSPTKFKNIVNAETGNTEYKQVPKRIRAWWWKNEAGKWNLVVRYGARIVELGKGKNSIELDNEAAILPTLDLIKKAVEAGELDAAIKAVSKVVELKLD